MRVCARKRCVLVLKPIFHRKLHLRRLPNANEINTKNMKCTCPTQGPNARDPTQPMFHWLALGFASGKTQLLGFASCKTRRGKRKRYQHVGILASGNAKVSSFASGNAKVPNASSFASQWNIGFSSYPTAPPLLYLPLGDS